MPIGRIIPRRRSLMINDSTFVRTAGNDQQCDRSHDDRVNFVQGLRHLVKTFINFDIIHIYHFVPRTHSITIFVVRQCVHRCLCPKQKKNRYLWDCAVLSLRSRVKHYASHHFRPEAQCFIVRLITCGSMDVKWVEYQLIY